MVFLVFWFCLVKDGFGAKNQLLPRKKIVFLRQSRPKPSFFVGKVGFPMKNHLFTRQNQKKHLFQHPLPILYKRCFFFWFLVLPRTSLGPEPFSSTCSYAWRLVGFGPSYINLSNSIPIPINVKGFLTIFIGLLFFHFTYILMNFQRVLIQHQRIPNTFQ